MVDEMVEPSPAMVRSNTDAQEKWTPGALSRAPMTRPFEQTGGVDETAVVDRARNGDFRAFTELVERYEASILRLTRHFTRSQWDAEEALQGTFLEAYENLGELRGSSEFRPWLIRIAVRQALMRPRAQNKDRAVSLDELFDVEEETVTRETVIWKDIPESICSLEENREIPDRALESLRPVLRAVFILRDMEGIRTEDTAAMLHLPVQAVRRRLLRARMQLRERLSPYFKRDTSEARAGQTQFRPPALS
jgi:RNA polymerase sigma-70 factor (ECF subfamily)